MAAFDLKGHVINVGDYASILGNIVSVSNNLSVGSVIIQPPLSANTFTVGSADVLTTVSNTTEGGGKTGVQLAAGQDCVVSAVVTAISGSGNTATLTLQTLINGTIITVPAGAVYVNQ
jgi:hypothetical protein